MKSFKQPISSSSQLPFIVKSTMWNWVYTSVHFQTSYKESWKKIRDGGYKLRLDAIPFQSAKASADILSDVSLQLLFIVS